MAFGFINGKLEIKFLILYIMARLDGAATFDTLQELCLCDGGVDYFSFSECLADLVHTRHVAQSPEGLYAITEKGRANSSICESSLPYAVRLRADRNLEGHSERQRRKALVSTELAPRPGGGYTVTLTLNDELDQVLQLQLLATRRDIALALQRRFEEDAERVYTGLLDLLCSQPPAAGPSDAGGNPS